MDLSVRQTSYFPWRALLTIPPLATRGMPSSPYPSRRRVAGMGYGITSATGVWRGIEIRTTARANSHAAQASSSPQLLLTLPFATAAAHAPASTLVPATATVLTVCAGLSPTMASSAVHLAQLGTTALSGYSHRQVCDLPTSPSPRLPRSPS